MSARGVAKLKRIDSIKFSLMDPNEIRKMSAVEVKTADTYKDDGHAFKQGLMDPLKWELLTPVFAAKHVGISTTSVRVTSVILLLNYQLYTLDSLLSSRRL